MALMTRQKLAGLFNCVLQGDGVDHGGQHAHVIGGDAVHAYGLLGDATEEVTAADDDADLTAGVGDLGDLLGDGLDEYRIDTETATRGQGLTRELEQNTLVHWLQCTRAKPVSCQVPANDGVGLVTDGSGTMTFPGSAGVKADPSAALRDDKSKGWGRKCLDERKKAGPSLRSG